MIVSAVVYSRPGPRSILKHHCRFQGEGGRKCPPCLCSGDSSAPVPECGATGALDVPGSARAGQLGVGAVPVAGLHELREAGGLRAAARPGQPQHVPRQPEGAEPHRHLHQRVPAQRRLGTALRHPGRPPPPAVERRQQHGPAHEDLPQGLQNLQALLQVSATAPTRSVSFL